MTPIEFEEHCKALLMSAGWQARTTSGSGDQGADVVCESSGRRLVVQCKYYSQPVGNAAVQEVVGARLFYTAHLAAVVSNATFTKSAQELAKKSDVALLHHTMLTRWAKSHLGSTERLVVNVDDMVAILNAMGYVTLRGEGGRFQITMPDGGTRHMGTDGAFLAFAEGLRRESAAQIDGSPT
ncbi:restriction endonuclease [Hydrogenophaga aquatica]